jgi:hypothetical protein
MTIRISTGLAKYMLDTGNVKQALTNCHIDFYSGTQTSTPDDPPPGTYLGSATLNGDPFVEGSPGNGLNFGTAVGRVLSKSGVETWKIKFTATGTVASFRIKANAVDNNLASTTLIRIDGSCGIGTTFDMQFANLDAIPNKIVTIDDGDLRLPLAV